MNISNNSNNGMPNSRSRYTKKRQRQGGILNSNSNKSNSNNARKTKIMKAPTPFVFIPPNPTKSPNTVVQKLDPLPLAVSAVPVPSLSFALPSKPLSNPFATSIPVKLFNQQAIADAKPSPKAVDLNKKVDWSWDTLQDGFKSEEIELFCRKVHRTLTLPFKGPFPSNFHENYLKVKLAMSFINKFYPFKAPTGQTLEREHVQGEKKYDDVKKTFELEDGMIWNDTGVSEGLIKKIGDDPDNVCINRPGRLVLTKKLSSDVLAHICQLAGAIPFEVFLELLLIQRKSKFLWCFAKNALKKVGVGIFSASTLNPNNIRDHPQTRRAERYWEAQMTYYISLCTKGNNKLKFEEDDSSLEIIEKTLNETAALAAAGNATFRCLRYFSVTKLQNGTTNALRRLTEKLHDRKESEALTSMFIKDASIENVTLLSNSFFFAHATEQYGTLMESLGYSIMDTLYELSKREGSASDDYIRFLFELSSIPSFKSKERDDMMSLMISIMIKIGKGTRAQLPLILMEYVDKDTRLLYAMFELAVYAGCDKIIFFIKTIKPQIEKMVTSLAVAVNDRSHPVSAYLLGTAGSNSEAEGPKSRGRGHSPVRNAIGLSFQPLTGLGRSRVSRVLECDIRSQKTGVFVKNILLELKKGTYKGAGSNSYIYNFFANIGGMPWTTRFNTKKEIELYILAYNMIIFTEEDLNDGLTDKLMTLFTRIVGKPFDQKITKAEYDAVRAKMGLSENSMVDAYYVPFTKEEFEGEFSKSEFSKTLKQVGAFLKVDVATLLYPEVEVFENAQGDLELDPLKGVQAAASTVGKAMTNE
jgi:hypothetical protein